MTLIRESISPRTLKSRYGGAAGDILPCLDAYNQAVWSCRDGADVSRGAENFSNHAKSDDPNYFRPFKSVFRRSPSVSKLKVKFDLNASAVHAPLGYCLSDLHQK